MSSEHHEIEAHGRALRAELDAADLARQEYLARLHPPCPQDGLPGDYIGISGSYGSARWTFLCPNGDRFTYHQDTYATRLIRPERWSYIRLEPLDLLAPASPDSSPHQPDQSAGSASGASEDLAEPDAERLMNDQGPMPNSADTK
jgi:hypothetical protein